MTLLAEEIEAVLADFFERAEYCRLHGIPLVDVVNGNVTVPPGWLLDPEMEYFLPPTDLLS